MSISVGHSLKSQRKTAAVSFRSTTATIVLLVAAIAVISLNLETGRGSSLLREEAQILRALVAVGPSSKRRAKEENEGMMNGEGAYASARHPISPKETEGHVVHKRPPRTQLTSSVSKSTEIESPPVHSELRAVQSMMPEVAEVKSVADDRPHSNHKAIFINKEEQKESGDKNNSYKVEAEEDDLYNTVRPTFDKRRIINYYATDLSMDIIIPPFPQWRLLSDRYGRSRGGGRGSTPTRLRVDLMKNPAVCKDLMEHEAMADRAWGVSDSSSSSEASLSSLSSYHQGCEWYVYGQYPISASSKSALSFAAQVRKHFLETFRIDLNNKSSVQNALGCLVDAGIGRFPEGSEVNYTCAEPMEAAVIEGFAEILSLTFVQGEQENKKLETAAQMPLTPPPCTLSADSLPLLVTRLYEGGGAFTWDWMGMSDIPFRLLRASADRVLSETLYHTNKSLTSKHLFRSMDVLAEVEKPLRPLQLAVPTPAELSALSPSSPLVVTIVAAEQLRYYGDGEPRLFYLNDHKLAARKSREAPKPINNVVFPKESKVLEEWNEQSSGGENFTSFRRRTDGPQRYEAFGSLIESSRMALRAGTKDKASVRRDLQNNPFVDVYDFPFSGGQLLLTMTDRLVRLGPSANAFYGELIETGIESAVHDEQYEGTITADGAAVADVPIPGVLRKALPAGSVKSSTIDAMSGNWNMSDLPSWLHIPSVVNVPECLDPPNVFNDGERRHHFVPGHDLHEPAKSVLIIGPSHARNVFTSLCTQYVYGVGRKALLNLVGNQRRYAFWSASALCETYHGHDIVRIVRRDKIPHNTNNNNGINDNNSALPPIPIAFGWSSMDPFRMIERLTSQLLEALEDMEKKQGKKGTHSSKNTSLFVRRLATRHPNDVVREMAKQLPVFTQESFSDQDEDQQQSSVAAGSEAFRKRDHRRHSFGFTNLLLRARRGDFVKLLGLFSHVVFLSGVWEASYRDGSFPEVAENIGISLDLIEEVFAPQKIIRYDPHRWWPADGRSSDPTPEYYDRMEHERIECRTHQGFAKYRDAHLCGASEPMRERVRRSWAEEEIRIEDEIAVTGGFANGTKTARAHASQRNRVLSRSFVLGTSAVGTNSDAGSAARSRAAVEVFDPTPATSDSIALIFSDVNGHHYKAGVMEAITQRILRDHVCPPRFVVASREKSAAGGLDLRGGKDGDDTGRPRVNYANSLLPEAFPFPDGVDKVFVRVRNAADSADLMPTLHSALSPTPALRIEIHNLFPLVKSPLRVVSDGVCRAIFDHPLSEINNLTRAVRRNERVSRSLIALSYGTRSATKRRAGPSASGWGWWRSIDPGSSPVDTPPPPYTRSQSKDVVTYFPLEVNSPPYLASASFNNPYMPNIECLFIHPRRLFKDSVARDRETLVAHGKRMEFEGGDGDDGLSQRMFVPPDDASYQHFAFPVYKTTRHNPDPLYLLRTIDYNFVSKASMEASCAVSRYANLRGGEALDRGSSYPAHEAPFHANVPREIHGDKPCALPPHEEVRSRMIVRAYLRFAAGAWGKEGWTRNLTTP